MQIIHTFPFNIFVSLYHHFWRSHKYPCVHLSLLNYKLLSDATSMWDGCPRPRRSDGWIEKLFSNIISNQDSTTSEMLKETFDFSVCKHWGWGEETQCHGVAKVSQLLVVIGLNVVLSWAVPRPGLGPPLPRLEQRHRLGRPRQHLHLRRQGEQLSTTQVFLHFLHVNYERVYICIASISP